VLELKDLIKKLCVITI